MKTAFTALVIAALLLSGRSLLATPYQITDLGTLGGTISYAFGVNIHGDVAGSSTTPSGAEHAFLYHNGVMSDLGVLNAGDTFSRAYGINDPGVVVGQSNGATSSPFYYSAGQLHFVGSLGGNYGFASKINAAGQIVGISADQNGVTHAFRYTSGTMTNLGSLSAAHDYSIAGGINSSGDVTGYSTTSASNYDAFLYHAGSIQDLGNLYSNSRGFGINDAVYVAGASVIDAAGDEHAFLWHAGVMMDLGTTGGAVTSQGLNINSLNQVVGTLGFGAGLTNRGFLWSNGVMTDVNNLLPANSGWILRDAQAINDLGQIVGFGNIGGQQHAYLLSPVPEQSTIVLFAAGAIPLVLLARRVSPGRSES
jgi:probable HAF family extracellular repeat protein